MGRPACVKSLKPHHPINETYMNTGDMVRFRTSDEISWDIGILIEYEKLLKVAKILAHGKVVSIHVSYVQLHQRHPDNVEMLKRGSI